MWSSNPERTVQRVRGRITGAGEQDENKKFLKKPLFLKEKNPYFDLEDIKEIVSNSTYFKIKYILTNFNKIYNKQKTSKGNEKNKNNLINRQIIIKTFILFLNSQITDNLIEADNLKLDEIFISFAYVFKVTP